MSRLVIVSNRVVDLDNQVQSGGLAVALGDALRSIGGIWFGWDGNVVEQGKPIEVRRTVQNNVTIATIPMTERDYEEYYLGFSNKVLWPVYHCRLDLAQFEPAYFEGYKRVNKGFATALAPLLRADDMVWRTTIISYRSGRNSAPSEPGSGSAFSFTYRSRRRSCSRPFRPITGSWRRFSSSVAAAGPIS